jgi:hypothetical protein
MTLYEITKKLHDTIQALLLQEFTRVCFGEGKGFEKALLEIEKIYLESK